VAFWIIVFPIFIAAADGKRFTSMLIINKPRASVHAVSIPFESKRETIKSRFRLCFLSDR